MIRRELTVFLVVGLTTVLIDFALYRALLAFTSMPLDIAKAAGFIAGTVFAYFANRFWTFGKKTHAPGSAWRFVLLYAITLSANVLINWWMLNLLAGIFAGLQMAFLLATGVSACLNFIGMKYLVFNSYRAEKYS